MHSCFDRCELIQSPQWLAGKRSSLCPYSPDHCCHCSRPVGSKPVWILTTRDRFGGWWVVRPDSPSWPDEGLDPAVIGTSGDRTRLPIGITCLKKHPEYRIGLIDSPRKDGE